MDKRRDFNLKFYYGISLDDYNALLEKQARKCAACGISHHPAPREARLVVDHNHSTGEVRGLLCGPCNRALGQAKDSAEVLRGLITYLESR